MENKYFKLYRLFIFRVLCHNGIILFHAAKIHIISYILEFFVDIYTVFQL